jgi:hypothetical protein
MVRVRGPGLGCSKPGPGLGNTDPGCPDPYVPRAHAPPRPERTRHDPPRQLPQPIRQQQSKRRSQRMEPAGEDQRTGQMQKRGRDVGPALAADGQTAVGQQPGQRPLHLPTMTTQPLARLHPMAGNARADFAPPQQPPAGRIVVTLIAMELGRSPTRPPRPAPWPDDRRHSLTMASSSCES